MANEASRLSGEEGFAFWDPMVAVYRGWAMAEQGDLTGGIAHMRDGLARYRAAGNGCTQCHMIGALAEALWTAGQWDEAFSVLREGMTLAKANEEGFYEPEFYRLRGEFLLAQALGNAGSANTLSDRSTLLSQASRSIQEGLTMARGQEAKSLELRGLMSLCRVQRETGDPAEAKQALRALYNSFSEGLGTPDLRDARALLAEL
jgi:predicted ATPase